MHYARAAHAVVSTGNAIYALAGTGAGNAPVLAVERFDGRSWVVETQLPGAGLNAPAAVALDDRIYVIGGFNTTTNVPSDRVLVYDPARRSWSQAAPLPSPRGGHAAVVWQGKIHVVGGGNSQSTIADHSVYDPAANTWSAAAPLPRTEGSPAAVVFGGKLYSIGGRSGPDDFGAVDVYDAASNRWSRGPAIEPRGTAGAVVYCGGIYLFGGESQARAASLSEVLRLDQGAGRWKRALAMPTARNFARAVLFRSRVCHRWEPQPGTKPRIGRQHRRREFPPLLSIARSCRARSIVCSYISPVPACRLSLLLPLIVGSLSACGDSKSPVSVVELVPSGDTLLTPYSEVTAAAWLGGSRWAVLAPSDEAVAIADFGTRALTPLGGRSSKVLRNPSNLFASGDTLYVGDWGLRRLTLWTPSGRLARSIPAADAVRGTLPRARDRAGHFYLDLYPPPGPDGSGNRDSAAVVRVDGSFVRADTLARLAPLDIAEVQGDAGRRFERRVFSGMDRWGVLPDGTLWLARVYDNRVDWRTPDGHWTRGQPLPDRVLEVTRYDRELFFRKFPPELRRTAQDLPFAAIKPPFEDGISGARGDVWLEKSRAPADSSRRYHVVNRQGRLGREIRVPGHGRILAVGANSVLVVEPTPQGIRLIRIGLPPDSLSPAPPSHSLQSRSGGLAG